MSLLLGVGDLARLALHRKLDRFGHHETLGLERDRDEGLERLHAAASYAGDYLPGFGVLWRSREFGVRPEVLLVEPKT